MESGLENGCQVMKKGDDDGDREMAGGGGEVVSLVKEE